MPKYTYTVINKENKQLNGSINAPDEATARQELNGLGFSILSIQQTESEISEQSISDSDENIHRYEFQAIDKNGKKVVGTIEGEDIYPVYKRLLSEYQFDVKALYEANLTEEEKQKAIAVGIDELKDRLEEEQLEFQAQQQKQQLDQLEFQKKQEVLKNQVKFVLNRVNDFITQYKEELRPEVKAKIKYFVDKILRIQHSTNLEYIKDTCIELLEYIQKEEIFIHTEQRRTEKNQLTLEAKTMMMELNKVNNPAQIDLFEQIRIWRLKHIAQNENPNTFEQFINGLLIPFFGPANPPKELLELKERINNLSEQIKQYWIIYFKAKDPGFKAETRKTIKVNSEKKKELKKQLKELQKRLNEENLKNIEYTSFEIVLLEIYRLASWVLGIYIVYYFITIYANSKEIPFLMDSRFNQIFQTSIIKYFFITLFLFVCFLGIKIEFFKRKKYSTPIIFMLFVFSSLLINLNF
ncbi:hypothetical protein GF376_00340 [Candidatus Peregrinibacteria bacterium]|nr:hypothetical protein [Candidatus Peregrinibacteria bacterium]